MYIYIYIHTYDTCNNNHNNNNNNNNHDNSNNNNSNSNNNGNNVGRNHVSRNQGATRALATTYMPVQPVPTWFPWLLLLLFNMVNLPTW